MGCCIKLNIIHPHPKLSESHREQYRIVQADLLGSLRTVQIASSRPGRQDGGGRCPEEKKSWGKYKGFIFSYNQEPVSHQAKLCLMHSSQQSGIATGRRHCFWLFCHYWHRDVHIYLLSIEISQSFIMISYRVSYITPVPHLQPSGCKPGGKAPFTTCRSFPDARAHCCPDHKRKNYLPFVFKCYLNLPMKVNRSQSPGDSDLFSLVGESAWLSCRNALFPFCLSAEEYAGLD